jgi:hypothetical protein
MYVARRIRSQDVLDQLYELFLTRGTPEYIRSVCVVKGFGLEGRFPKLQFPPLILV